MIKIFLVASVCLVSTFFLSTHIVMAQNSIRTAKKSGSTTVIFKSVAINGQTIFYREAGEVKNPVVLFLHGFPSSSRMWQPLLKALATNYHVIAPDYIGFGHSSQPAAGDFNYTFEHLASYIDSLIIRLSLKRFVMVQQDYGGPIGMRIAEKNPEKIQAIIIQNAVCHQEGLSPLWETRKAFWADKEKYYDAVKKNFISLEATRQRHIGASPTPEIIDPDTYTDEYLFLNKPGMAAIQLDLFYDYQNNVSSYPKWQAWLRKNQPKMQVIWGKYDPSFTIEGAWKYKEDVPAAEVHLVEGGHFALDEAQEEILGLMTNFLKRVTVEK